VIDEIDEAKPAAVTLALENTPATSPATFNALFQELANQPTVLQRVGMCFDMGHANLHPATRNDYLGYLDQLETQVPLVHVHLHENFGEADRHLPVGQGPAGENPTGLAGLLRRLRQRNYQGSLIMEQWPDPPNQLDDAAELLRQQLQQPASPAPG
jgi:sugar phosphate isomerase/epimerase